MDTQVSNTILTQMGGARRLQLFIGAKQFLTDTNSLQFRFPAPSGIKFNRCQIRYEQGADDYTVTFDYVRAGRTSRQRVFEHVYADMLQRLFEETTGLYLRLSGSPLRQKVQAIQAVNRVINS